MHQICYSYSYNAFKKKKKKNGTHTRRGGGVQVYRSGISEVVLRYFHISNDRFYLTSIDSFIKYMYNVYCIKELICLNVFERWDLERKLGVEKYHWRGF